jgi:hypothetical protein
MLSVIHKPSKDGTKVYANVGSVVALPKGMPCPDLVNPAVKFDIGEFDETVFNSLPEWLRAKILLSKEMEGDVPTSKPAKQEPIIDSEEVPF